MPRYVERDGETVYRPPYEQKDTSLSGWLVRSNRASLQAILDRDLNRPAGGAVDYRPLTSTVLLSIASIRQIHSLDPRDAGYGWIAEIDVCVWILTGAFKDGELDHIAWYVPYIWVDNPYAMATGRETLGYPKTIGWMKTPADRHDPGPLWLDSLVLSPHAPTTELKRERIFTLRRASDTGTAPEAWADDAKDAFLAIARMFFALGDVHCDWARFVSAFKDLLGGHMPLVFLKQFRDSATPDQACYQAIVEASATVQSFRRGGLLPGDWQLDLNQYDSLRMRSNLGLEATTRIEHGFWLDFSFSMDLGGEVWRAS